MINGVWTPWNVVKAAPIPSGDASTKPEGNSVAVPTPFAYPRMPAVIFAVPEEAVAFTNVDTVVVLAAIVAVRLPLPPTSELPSRTAGLSDEIVRVTLVVGGGVRVIVIGA